MGWSSGSRLMSVVIETIKENCDREGQREQIYKNLIIAFENEDCDTLMECLGEDKAFDFAYKQLNPDSFEKDDDFDADFYWREENYLDNDK